MLYRVLRPLCLVFSIGLMVLGVTFSGIFIAWIVVVHRDMQRGLDPPGGMGVPFVALVGSAGVLLLAMLAAATVAGVTGTCERRARVLLICAKVLAAILMLPPLVPFVRHFDAMMRSHERLILAAMLISWLGGILILALPLVPWRGPWRHVCALALACLVVMPAVVHSGLLGIAGVVIFGAVALTHIALLYAPPDVAPAHG